RAVEDVVSIRARDRAGLRGREVVVLDRADPLRALDRRVLGAREPDLELLVGLDPGVALDRDRDRLRRLAGGEAKLAACRQIVALGPGRAIRAREVNARALARVARARHREAVVGRAGVSLLVAHVVDRE